MALDDTSELQTRQEASTAAIAQGTFNLENVLEYIHTVHGGMLGNKYRLDESKPSVSGGQAIVAFGTCLQTEEQLAFKFFQLHAVYEQEVAVYLKLVSPSIFFHHLSDGLAKHTIFM